MIFGDFSIYSAPPLAIISKETRFTIDSALHYVLRDVCKFNAWASWCGCVKLIAMLTPLTLAISQSGNNFYKRLRVAPTLLDLTPCFFACPRAFLRLLPG